MNHTNDNEEEQDLTAAAGEGNTKQAVNRTLQTYTKREGFSITVERKQFTGQMIRRNAENFKSDESKRGIEPNQISKRIRYQKQTRIFAVFQRKLRELQPLLSERKGHPNS